MTNTMQERFEEKAKKLFTQNGLSVLLDYPPHEMVLDEQSVIDFIQSEIDLAVAKREKEIVERIRNTFKCEVVDGIKTGIAYMGEKNIIDLITTK